MPYLELGEATLHYREAGAGRLAVFVHGFPFDATMWRHQLSALGGTRRCVAVDLRGFGRSSPNHARVLSMEVHAADVAAAIEALSDQPADVVALSMGGYVALALWEQRPDVVRSLVLADTKAGADGEEAKAGRDAAAARLVAEGRSAWAAGLIEVLLAPDADSWIWAEMRDLVENTSYQTIRAALEGMKVRPDRTSLLPTITVPTMVVFGEQDRLMPPEVGKGLAAAIPGARFEVIVGAGHMAPLEQPAAFNALLRDFWSSGES